MSRTNSPRSSASSSAEAQEPPKEAGPPAPILDTTVQPFSNGHDLPRTGRKTTFSDEYNRPLTKTRFSDKLQYGPNALQFENEAIVKSGGCGCVIA